MIDRAEIIAKGAEFVINPSDVQRDYVFGWVLAAIYGGSCLGEILVLKGGNALRKAYLSGTRFSPDLDFSSQARLDLDFLKREFDAICDVVSGQAGVPFQKDRNDVKLDARADEIGCSADAP